jgi:hypothetical protein
MLENGIGRGGLGNDFGPKNIEGGGMGFAACSSVHIAAKFKHA